MHQATIISKVTHSGNCRTNIENPTFLYISGSLRPKLKQSHLLGFENTNEFEYE